MEERIISFLDAINSGIDTLFAVLFVLGLLVWVVSYTVGKVRGYAKKNDSPSKGIFLGIIMLVFMALEAFTIIQFPITLEKAFQAGYDWSIRSDTFRWILLYLIIPPYFYLATRKYSGWRGFFAAIIITTIGLAGWQFERWIGILLISLPIYAVLLYLIYHYAQVILPSLNPVEKKERALKFNALLSFMLGAQFPVWVAKESAGRDFEMRIAGDNSSGKGIEPGIVWTH
jgi:hypothetical protein